MCPRRRHNCKTLVATYLGNNKHRDKGGVIVEQFKNCDANINGVKIENNP